MSRIKTLVEISNMSNEECGEYLIELYKQGKSLKELASVFKSTIDDLVNFIIDFGYCFCTVCRELHPFNEFYNDSSRPLGIETKCKKVKNNKCIRTPDIIFEKYLSGVLCVVELSNIFQTEPHLIINDLTSIDSNIILYKKCSGECNEILPFSSYSYKKSASIKIESRCANCQSIYYHLNKDRILEQQNVYTRNREQYDSVYKLRKRFSNLIRSSLKGQKDNNSLKNLVNYTQQDLRMRLESLFQDGMTWDNYGEWHIDHIKPVSSFNITSYNCEDFKKCWCLENLQPLWAEDNRKKSNQWDQQEYDEYCLKYNI